MCSFILSEEQQFHIWWRLWDYDGSAFTLSLPERQDKKISQGRRGKMELCPLGGCHPSATFTGAMTEGTYVTPTPEDSDNISTATAPQSWAQQALTELEKSASLLGLGLGQCYE